MKITVFLLLTSVFCSFAGNTYSQSAKVNLDMNNVELEKCLMK